MEEIKSHIPEEIQMYLDEQRVDTLYQAAVRAYDYSFMHKTAFGRTCPQSLDQSQNMPGEEGVPSNVHGSSPSASRNLMSSTNANNSHLSAGLTCFYCNKRGHIMSECHTLEKKNKRAIANPLIVSSLS